MVEEIRGIISAVEKLYDSLGIACGTEDVGSCIKRLVNVFNKTISESEKSSIKIGEINKVIENSFEDAEAIYNNDPSAGSKTEVMICYPGFKAIFFYRIANLLYIKGYKLLARVISEKAHSETGIDINPGATIGRRFAIDHGTGVVIGETAEIGDDVVIYQGVTLGAKHLKERDQVGQKRHPTIEDSVVIYANATILGGSTVIGKNSIIGANAFITYSIKENSKVI